MWHRLFESRRARELDRTEVSYYLRRFGDEAKRIISRRAMTARTPRDRKHWQRIARKI